MLKANPKKNRILMKGMGFIAGGLACFFLYYGTAMLFMVPGSPAAAYFGKPRIVYGFVPTALSIALLVLAGWFWSRATSGSLGKSIGLAFRWSISLIVLFWVGLIVVAHLQGRIP
jgi:hypothetical protein